MKYNKDFAYLCSINQKISYMKKIKQFCYQPDPDEMLEKHIETGCLFSIKATFSVSGFVSSFCSLSSFDCDFSFSPISWSFCHDSERDDTWAHFGRSYFQSRDYRLDDFHFTLCSIDELKRKVDLMQRQYEQSLAESLALFLPAHATANAEEVPFEGSICHLHFDESELFTTLRERVEGWRFSNRTIAIGNVNVPSSGYIPYNDSLSSLRLFAQLSRCGQVHLASTAWRPCCRSFLMAKCCQASGDDLLGH